MHRKELYDLLESALRTPGQRQMSVKRFQSAIFDANREELGLTEIEWDIFTQLAQDLDFYESDPVMRREDPVFYGDERLSEEIVQALGKLQFQVDQ
jgi:hypothetical protein